MAKKNATIDHLRHAIWSLKVDWEIYRQLYGGEQAAVDELNRRTGHFFGRIEQVFPDRVILAVANLVDKDSRVLAFHFAVRELRLPATDPTGLKIQRQLKSLEALCKVLVEHRNNRIAHQNADVALAKKTLSKLTIKMIGDAIEAAEELHGTITLLVDGSSTSWKMEGFAGVKPLVKVLKAGNDALDVERNKARESRKKLLRGEIPPDFDAKRDLKED
jgi:hypothetical protein